MTHLHCESLSRWSWWRPFHLLAVLMGAWFGAQVLAAEPVIRLDQLGQDSGLVIGRQLSVLEDQTALKDIDWVSAPANARAFVPSATDRPNFGYSGSAYWLRFTIDPASERAELLLELATPTLDQAQLFSPRPGGGFSVQTAGDQMPWAARPLPHRNLVFRLVAPPGAPATFYLRLASRSAVTAPLTLWRDAAFHGHDQLATLILGLFYGVLAAQFFYNLFLYFSLRDRAYLLVARPSLSLVRRLRGGIWIDAAGV